MSYLFDGVDDSLLTATPPATTYPFTMACWFWPTNTTAYQTLMMLCDTAVSTRYHLLAFAADLAGDPVQYQANAATAVSANTSTTVTASVWNHACCVGTSATDRAVFLNGGGKGTNATSRTPTGINRFVAGRFMASVNAFPYTGRIGEMAVWNTNLTDAEVAVLARGIPANRFKETNLVGYWPLGYNPDDYKAGVGLTASGAAVNGDHPTILASLDAMGVS